DAAPGNRMPVDRGDHRPGKGEERSHEPGQQGEEAPDVVRAFPGEPEQVHPRGEDRARSRQDEGPDVLGDAVQFAEEGVEQLHVEGAGLPVRQAEGENALVLRTFDHLPRLRAIQRVCGPCSRCDLPGHRTAPTGGWQEGAGRRTTLPSRSGGPGPNFFSGTLAWYSVPMKNR